MNDYQGLQFAEQRRRDLVKEVELERLVQLARSLDEQKRGTGLLQAVVDATRNQLGKMGGVREAVPVTVLAAE